MSAAFILNPYAGRWLAKKHRARVEALLAAAGIQYKTFLTEHPGHATELARQAVLEGYNPIIAGGGDGSISEVVNGFYQTGIDSNQLPGLGLIPLGSANDLVKNLGLPTDLPEAVKVIAGNHIQHIDLGRVTFTSASSPALNTGIRVFDNNSALGLEPTVTCIQQDIRWLRGKLRYILAALIGVYYNRSWRVSMDWEGGHFEGRTSMITVGNGRQTGGFYLTPGAKMDDGELTFVYGYVACRREMLALLPRALTPGQGNFVEHPAVFQVNSPWITVTLHDTSPLHTDGEIQAYDAATVRFDILPKALKIIGSAN